VQINPESLTEAALSIGRLGEALAQARQFPDPGAQRGVVALNDSPIATAPAGADAVSAQAKRTLQSRYAGIAGLLYDTATSYADSDQALADSLAQFGDLNSTGA
jgi:hypothetical protein